MEQVWEVVDIPLSSITTMRLYLENGDIQYKIIGYRSFEYRNRTLVFPGDLARDLNKTLMVLRLNNPLLEPYRQALLDIKLPLIQGGYYYHDPLLHLYEPVATYGDIIQYNPDSVALDRHLIIPQ